jgi:hypothetical protein
MGEGGENYIKNLLIGAQLHHTEIESHTYKKTEYYASFLPSNNFEYVAIDGAFSEDRREER